MDKTTVQHPVYYVYKQYRVYRTKIESLKKNLYWSANYVYMNTERRFRMVNKAVIVSSSRCSILQKMALQYVR